MALRRILHNNSQVCLIVEHFLEPEQVAQMLDKQGFKMCSRLFWQADSNAMQMLLYMLVPGCALRSGIESPACILHGIFPNGDGKTCKLT